MTRILVFVMRGCPACHDYIPRFKRLAAPLRSPNLRFHVLDVDHRTLPRPAQAIARTVRATPTTILLEDGRGEHLRRVGALSDAEIAELLTKAQATAT